MENQIVSLEAILADKEGRVRKHQELIKAYKRPVVSFGLNIPGPIKDTPDYRFVHREGVRALLDALDSNHVNVLYKKVTDKVTGSEGFFSVDMEGKSLKEMTVEIEEKHPLGRLFDFDVIDLNSQSISRRDLNHSSRKCLICEERAVVCGRSRHHKLEDILQEIDTRILAYRKRVEKSFV